MLNHLFLKNQSVLTLVTVTFISAFLLFIGSDLIANLGCFMWVAPIVLLIYVFEASVVYASLAVFISYFLANFFSLYFQYQNLPSLFIQYVPTIPFIISALLDALLITIGILLTKFLITRKPYWSNLFFLPAYVTSYEYLTSILSESGRNDAIALTQIHYPLVLQIVAITGMWGLTFLLLLVPTGIALSWYYRQHIRYVIYYLGIPILLLSTALFYGEYRISHMIYTTKLRVGAAATAASIQDLKSTNLDIIRQVIDKNNQVVSQLAKQGVSYIVLPEKILTITRDAQNKILSVFSQIAKTNNVTLIVGFNLKEDHSGKNLTYTFSNNGNIISQYQKHHLVQFSSEANYQSGQGLSIFPIGKIKAGVSICHDLDFQQIGKQYATEHVNIIFAPALDFVTDAEMHIRPALMLSVENGFSLVRSAQWGLLSISDPTGKILAKHITSFDRDTTVAADVPIGNFQTFYSQHGDWFAWLSLLIAIVTLIDGVNVRYKTARL